MIIEEILFVWLTSRAELSRAELNWTGLQFLLQLIV